MKKNKTFSAILSTFIAEVAVWFISAAFIMWGWNTVAPHLNMPTFNFWEIFAIRMGLTYVMSILWQRPKK